MDKIDMTHHENYEKLIIQHDEELGKVFLGKILLKSNATVFCLEKVNEEHEQQLRELENQWKGKMLDVTTNIEQVREQIEKEAQQKMGSLVEQHRNELGNY